MHLSSLFPSKFSAAFKRMVSSIGDHDRPQLNPQGDMDCFTLMKPRNQTIAERCDPQSSNPQPKPQISQPASAHAPGNRAAVTGILSANTPDAAKKEQGLQVSHQPDFFGFSPDLLENRK